MLVKAERAFTDLAADEYRRAGDTWDVSEERAVVLEGYGLCSIVPDAPKPAPKRRTTCKKPTTKSE